MAGNSCVEPGDVDATLARARELLATELLQQVSDVASPAELRDLAEALSALVATPPARSATAASSSTQTRSSAC